MRNGRFQRLGRTALTEDAPVAQRIGSAFVDGLSAGETQSGRPRRAQKKQPCEAMRGDGERRAELPAMAASKAWPCGADRSISSMAGAAAWIAFSVLVGWDMGAFTPRSL